MSINKGSDKSGQLCRLVRDFAACIHKVPGHVAQLVTCLAADPGVASFIPDRSHTFAEIDHEIISTAVLLPSADSGRVVVSYKRKYVHKVLVNHLVKLAQEKVWLGELTIPA